MKDHKSSEVECEEVTNMTLGYLSSLIEVASTDAARQLMLDWKFVIERSKQKDGDV